MTTSQVARKGLVAPYCFRRDVMKAWLVKNVFPMVLMKWRASHVVASLNREPICIYITYYIYIWVNYNDLTVRPNPGIMVSKGNHPQMAELLRLVKYYNLPRYICVYMWLAYSLYKQVVNHFLAQMQFPSMALPSGKKRGWKIPEDLQAFRQLRQWWTSLDARNFLVPEDWRWTFSDWEVEFKEIIYYIIAMSMQSPQDSTATKTGFSMFDIGSLFILVSDLWWFLMDISIVIYSEMGL